MKVGRHVLYRLEDIEAFVKINLTNVLTFGVPQGIDSLAQFVFLWQNQ